MKDLKHILASVLMLGALAMSALAIGPQNDKNPPPPKKEKEVEKVEKKDPPPPPPPPRNDGGNNKGDKKGKP